MSLTPPAMSLRGEGTDQIEEQLREFCDFHSPAGAFADLDRAADLDEKLRAVYAVALTAPARQDEKIAGLFRELAASDDPRLRQSVVVATGYLPWPELRDLVRQLRDHDPVEHVRTNAGILLEGIRLHGTG